MLFKRRKPPTWGETLRIGLWPRRSWLRSGRYVTKRVLRLTASPHAIAAGVAAGAFTSFTPFLGLHFIFAGVLAWLCRGNLIASALGTFVGNPLTFPAIWVATFQTGHFILRTGQGAAETPALGEATRGVIDAAWALEGSAFMTALGDIWHPVLFPMTVGGLVVGLPVAIGLYLLTRRASLLFRESRRNKLMSKAAELRDRARQAAENKALAKTSGQGQNA